MSGILSKVPLPLSPPLAHYDVDDDFDFDVDDFDFDVDVEECVANREILDKFVQ